MEECRNELFFDQLTSLLDTAGLPAAIVDEQFLVVWQSRAGSVLLPSLSLPDGARMLLNGYPMESIKAEIARDGAFTTTAGHSLLSQRPVVICALPDGSGRYLLQPAGDSLEGTGMHPEGISRTLSSFGNQYRAPLTVIFSMLTLLSRACSPNATETDLCNTPEYLDAINQSALRLLRSCEWISDYTRLAYGFAPNRPRRVDLFSYLNELFSAAAEIIQPTGIPLSYTIPEGIFTIACDTDKLSAAILNILSNACRYTRPGNHITIKIRARRGQVSISIADRGLGIPADIQSRVFEPYFSYNHNGHPFAGNGLGLSIAHDSIAAIGGTVALTSTHGKGTTVVFSFPTADDDGAPPAVFCEAADYVADRFSPLRVALSDSIHFPI